MKILYDGFIYSLQRAGGINRYLANLIDGLPADWTPLLTVQETQPLTFPTHPRLAVKRFPLAQLRPRRLAEWATQRYYAGLETQRGLDLIHAVFHHSLSGNPAAQRRAPFLLTIHDMISEIFQADIDPTGNEPAVKRKAAASAAAIICDSHNTRADFLARNPFPADRVFVIHLASDFSRAMAQGDEPVPERPYFLFVGARPIYKNFVRLALAFAQVAEKWPDVELCVIGAPFDATEGGLLAALKIRPRVRNLGHLPDRHLAKLYRCSQALVYPSLYEGFGIPPLEAMACGALVIAGAVSSLPEVIGEAALRIDPQSVDSLVAAMLRVRELGNAEREALVAGGLAQAARFSWQETVRRTLDVYQTVTR